MFEDDIEELKTIERGIFDKEWHQIYGPFTLVVGGHEFIAYPTQNIPLSAKRLYSELILTHFDLLIDVYNSLKSYDYIALKYVENSWTWLEIQVENDILVLSELNYETTILKDLFIIDKSVLKIASFGSFSNIRISKIDFLSEIRIKTIQFFEEIQGINSNILDSVCFSKVLNFYNIYK
ncbi:hypothetical protein H1230_13050 [Paenibacillus sp. 19GGS1-52]|uniref:hypothetical protein n=1 Tax=Paenibacillus sp. 19GGS1-52 TaxID=2758563 RepID=UPI001EFC1CDF|nr:hypothetical protein [Paenibacillus sp. 19GGS1-52]ULO09609.1 hypothetical protein H1230_13050 [Paenibacillus sp. 19GGS1-52]